MLTINIINVDKICYHSESCDEVCAIKRIMESGWHDIRKSQESNEFTSSELENVEQLVPLNSTTTDSNEQVNNSNNDF